MSARAPHERAAFTEPLTGRARSRTMGDSQALAQ
jgi:hypothetical protein